MVLSCLPFNVLPLAPERASAEMHGPDLSTSVLSLLHTQAKTSWVGYPHFTDSGLPSQAQQMGFSSVKGKRIAKAVIVQYTRQVCSPPWQPHCMAWGAVVVWQTLKLPGMFTMRARMGSAVPGGLWMTQNRHGKYVTFPPWFVASSYIKSIAERKRIDHSLI